MSEVKFEPLLGDQSLFDGAPEDAEYAGWFCQEVRWYMILNGKILFSDGGSWCTSDNPYLSADIAAMRRIIKTPVWTVADQKAGRLPEVGWVVMVIDVDEVARIAAINNDSVCSVCVVFEDGGFITLHFSGIAPIETPAEKAARLKDEWCKSAAKKLKNLEYTSTLTSIYDAMLCGELPPVQAKDDE